MAAKKETLPKFHAKIAAPTTWKKRSADAKAIYNMIVEHGLMLHKGWWFHPKMPPITTAHMQTIIHNIGRLTADEITTEQAKYKKADTEAKKTEAKKTLTKKTKCTK
jgi:hypothetical protein